jgi:hypothetical protein
LGDDKVSEKSGHPSDRKNRSLKISTDVNTAPAFGKSGALAKNP